MKDNICGWFEIPVSDMKRAVAFYEAIFKFKMEQHKMGPIEMAWFPYSLDGKNAAGSLVYNKEFYKPSQDGSLVYLSCEDGAIQTSRVEKAGGKIVQSKKQISPEHGFMALIADTEGNRIGLHSEK